jgi:uncharacterized membrane protein
MEIPEKLIHPCFPSTLGYVVWSLTMVPFAIIAIRNAHWKLELDPKSILYGCAVRFSGAMGQNSLGCLLFVYAVRYGKAIIVVPMVNGLFPLVTIVLSLLIYQQIPARYNLTGMVLALIAIFAFDEVRHAPPS